MNIPPQPPWGSLEARMGYATFRGLSHETCHYRKSTRIMGYPHCLPGPRTPLKEVLSALLLLNKPSPLFRVVSRTTQA